MLLLINAIMVFSITLIITKSKIMASKREFVELRYESAKVGGQKPNLIHSWWHAFMTCPMCSGFWISIIIHFCFPIYGIVIDVLTCFAINWLIHCLENILFYSGELFKEILESEPKLK